MGYLCSFATIVITVSFSSFGLSRLSKTIGSNPLERSCRLCLGIVWKWCGTLAMVCLLCVCLCVCRAAKGPPRRSRSESAHLISWSRPIARVRCFLWCCVVVYNNKHMCLFVCSHAGAHMFNGDVANIFGLSPRPGEWKEVEEEEEGATQRPVIGISKRLRALCVVLSLRWNCVDGVTAVAVATWCSFHRVSLLNGHRETYTQIHGIWWWWHGTVRDHFFSVRLRRGTAEERWRCALLVPGGGGGLSMVIKTHFSVCCSLGFSAAFQI